MNDLQGLIARHGAAFLFGFCFLEAAGVPIPAALALLLGGAAVGQGTLPAGSAWLAGFAGLLAGDLLLFFLGRHTGWWLLGLLCRVTANPDACIFTSAHAFRKRGRATLVLSKFVPGLSAMAAPLAGSMNMRAAQFLALDGTGAALYVTAYGLLGYLCKDIIATVIGYFQAAGRVVETLLVGAVAGYLVWRGYLSWKTRELRAVPVLRPGDLKGLDEAQVLDVRSHGYYSSSARRIKGAARLEPNRLPEAMESLPTGKKLLLYCTCRNEATSIRVAHMLRQNGYETFVIRGGLKAWQQAGHETEPVPAAEIVELPSFRR